MYNEQILIVEDEPAIREMIVMTLEMAGFESLQAADVSEAHQQVVDHRPALILLDWMLHGDKSGIDFCRMLKNDTLLAEIPVIMLTAKSEEDSKVHGLDAGADDYLVKPFSFEELLARIRAVLRRPQDAIDNILHVGDLTLDTVNYDVRRGKTAIHLTSTEFALLEYLMRNQTRVMSKDKIVSHVWDFDADVLPNTVEAYISSLRHKIDKPFKGKPLIHTLRGFGYKVEG